ncbi:hypothetical protein N9043_02010 [bacterium]|nr:hypothetical protein [bacterium]
MSILESQKKEAVELGARYLGTTTVWNIHTTGIPDSDSSNLHGYLSTVFENEGVKRVSVLVGAKGRNAHSETYLNVFDVSGLSDEQRFDLRQYSNSNQYEEFEAIDCNHDYYKETGRRYF